MADFDPTVLDQPRRDDGGPAYPAQRFIIPADLEQRHVERLHEMQGMTLRDYFAGQAATGAFRGGDTDVVDAVFARRCYELADAMIAARKEGR